MKTKARGRRGVAVAIVASAFGISSAFAACTFPEVTFSSAPSAEGGDAAADTEASTEAAAPKKPDVDPEGGTKDAATLGDAATVIDAAGCTSCDCDGDGYARFEPARGCDGGPPHDCDDTVRAINPGQTGFVTDLWPTGAKHAIVGDWDCSGSTTRQYDYDATCEALSACQGGFQGNPPCGGTAPFLACNEPLPVLGLLCSVKSSEAAGKRTQGCH